MAFSIVIPARYDSTRLPGKPLRMIAGRPLIQHVHDRAAASGARRVLIATDDMRIKEVAERFGAEVCLTSGGHTSGTDRIAEAVAALGYEDDDIVVNLQGDEPLVPVANLQQVAANLTAQPEVGAATLCERITHAAMLFDPHVVKVVADHRGYALYFTRAAVPWDRQGFTGHDVALSAGAPHFRHIGLYAYRAGFLKAFVTWPPCALEVTEALEQLRILWYGRKVHVAEAVAPCPPGVDTEGDLARLERLMGDES